MLKSSIRLLKNALGEILSSGDYKKGLEKMGITYDELSEKLAKGGYQAVKLLAELGKLTSAETDSFWEKALDPILSDDTTDSIGRFNEVTKQSNIDLINNAGEYRDELLSTKKTLESLAKANPTKDNMETITNNLGANLRGVDLEEFKKAYKKNGQEILEYDSKTGMALVANAEVSQQYLSDGLRKYIEDENLVYIEGIGQIKDITIATSEDIKNMTVADVRAQIAINEELSKALEEVGKNQDNLGVGPNASGLEGIGEMGPKYYEVANAINAVIASGGNLTEQLPTIATMVGVDMESAFKLANAKINQFKMSIDQVRQTIPGLSSVMSTFTEEDPPSLEKAMERLTNKFKDQAAIQSNLKKLISINDGEFATLWKTLSAMSPEEQLTLGFDKLDLSDMKVIANLKDMQTKLEGAMTTFGAEATGNITAGAEAEAGKGVTFLDPIQKAFADLASDIDGKNLVPVVSPKIDPAFIARWNQIINSINAAERIGSNADTNYPLFGSGGAMRATGGPVWPGLRSSVNELGREGFVNSKGEFSMLPNTSSMKFNEYGTVIPAHMVGNSRGGVNINNNINVNGVSMQEIVEYQTALEQSQMRRMGGGL